MKPPVPSKHLNSVSVKPAAAQYRLCREERLYVRKRAGRKRALGTRAPMTVPGLPNQRWSPDSVTDQFTDCRRFRVLTVIDDCARECPALVSETSLSGHRVERELNQLITQRGTPKMVVSDNDTEFTSNAILNWADATKFNWQCIEPGTPQNGFIPRPTGDCLQSPRGESFNGKLRDEKLNETLFTTLHQARVELATWRNDYNHQRPHSSLAGQTPAKFANRARGMNTPALRACAPAPLAKQDQQDMINRWSELQTG